VPDKKQLESHTPKRDDKQESKHRRVSTKDKREEELACARQMDSLKHEVLKLK
jgi:hypothetical protein